LIIAPYKYSYLLSDQFVDNHLWQFYGIISKPHGGKFFFITMPIEWCIRTQMKADDKYDKCVEY